MHASDLTDADVARLLEDHRLTLIVAAIERMTPYWHSTGLPTTCTDILEASDADTDEDRDSFHGGCHYNYREQAWHDGHDHAHFDGGNGPLVFCGSDMDTCLGLK